MAPRNRLLLPLFLFCFFLAGSACLKDPYFPGKDPATLCLHINLAEREQITTRAAGSAIMMLQVTLSHQKIPPRSKTVAYNGEGEQTIVFDSLYPGTWKIEVSGIDESEDCIFYGESTLNIDPGKTVEVFILLLPAPGSLEIAMEISGLRALGVEVTKGRFYYYPDPKSGTSKTIDLELDGDWLRGEGKIPEGTYQGEIYIPQKTGTVYYRSPYFTFTIRAGKNTQLTIEADGGANVKGVIDSTPATPENFNIRKIEQGLFELSWEEVYEPDLAGYYIYRTNQEGRFVYLAEVPPGTHSYLDQITANLFRDGKLGYAVSSFDKSGNVSFWSEQQYIYLNEL